MFILNQLTQVLSCPLHCPPHCTAHRDWLCCNVQGVKDAVHDGAADELIRVAVEQVRYTYCDMNLRQLVQSMSEDAVNVHDVKASYRLLEADGARVIGHLIK